MCHTGLSQVNEVLQEPPLCLHYVSLRDWMSVVCSGLAGSLNGFLSSEV